MVGEGGGRDDKVASATKEVRDLFRPDVSTNLDRAVD